MDVCKNQSKSKAYIALLTFSFFLSATHASSNKLGSFLDLRRNKGTQQRCGDAHMNEIGAIYYKPFDPIVDHERCGWIIGVPGAKTYNIDIQHLGDLVNAEGSNVELIFTGVTYNETGQAGMTTYKPTEAGLITLANHHVIIITFHSKLLNEEVTTGFALQYEGLETGSVTNTTRLSTHHVFQPPTFEFKYPESRATYDSREFATFLFPTGSNLLRQNAKHVWYRKDSLEGNSCVDALHVWQYNVDLEEEGKWEYLRNICGNSDDLYFEHDDMTFITFKSDVGTNGRGFWFWYNGC